MSWRTVIISNRSKLDYKLDYLVVRGETTVQIHLSEISHVVIETTGVSITAALLSEMIKNKIKVIFCDDKRSPISELVPYNGSHDSADKIRNQVKWSNEIKEKVWSLIVREKIKNQYLVMKMLGLERYKLLEKYYFEVELGDKSNREGHAAKVYFNDIFGNNFSRKKDCNINAALNYGYTILLSSFNREININGYITQLGIFHNNTFNHFNFSSDLMEPFRYLVDTTVIKMAPVKFGWEEKEKLISLLDMDVCINNTTQKLNNAISIYTKSVINALNNRDISELRFMEFNEL